MRRFRSNSLQMFTPPRIDGLSHSRWLKQHDPKKYYESLTPAQRRIEYPFLNPDQPVNKKVVRTFGVVKGSYGGNALDDWLRSQGVDPSEFETPTDDKDPNVSHGMRSLGSVKRKATFTKNLDDSDDEDEEEGGGIIGDVLDAAPTFMEKLADFIDRRTGPQFSGKSNRGRGRTARGGGKLNFGRLRRYMLF